MGRSLGYDHNWKRDVGYGVPAVCDHPRCDEVIDRGLSHVCGGEPFGGEEGCGLFFCRLHMRISDEGRQVCVQCNNGWKPHAPKPDTREWLEWKLTDPSWAEWRDAEPDEVRRIEAALSTPTPTRPSASGRDEGERA